MRPLLRSLFSSSDSDLTRSVLSCSKFILLAMLLALAAIGPKKASGQPVAVPQQPASTIAATLEGSLPKPPVVAAAPADARAFEEQRLAALPETQLEANNVPLRSVIRWLAEQSGMHYIGLPDRPEGTIPVTFASYANPYDVLKSVTEANNVGMQFTRGMWHFYFLNNQELVARIYQLKHNTMETFEANSGASNSSNSGYGGGNQQQAGVGNMGNMSGNSMGGGNSGYGNGSLGGSQRTQITAKSDAIVKAIEDYIGLDTTAAFATFLADGSVGGFFPIPKPDMQSAIGADQAASNKAKKGLVRFISDNNQLYVVATRQQHEYIEGFLEALDRPQKLIAIETKIIETSRDLSRELGVDWSGVTSPSFSVSGLSTDINLNKLSATQWPTSGILSASDLSLGLKAIAEDSRSSVAGYPRVVTLNNRQASLQSVVQRPVKRATTSSSSSGGLVGSQTIASVESIDVGTVIDIFPKILGDGNVLLNVVISVSNITGTVSIDGNPYPVVGNRLFSYEVIVKSGFTLAVGGLEETVDTTSLTKVPGFGDVPFFGRLFSKSNPARNNRTLMLLVTPTILDGYSGGLSDRPGNTLRQEKSAPRYVFRGEARESIADVRRALSGFPQEIDLLAQLALEGRATKADLVRLDLLVNELDLMRLKLAEKSPRAEPDLGAIKTTIDGLQRRLEKVRGDVRRSAKFAGA